MTQPPPAAIGDAIEDVDTPALLIDLNVFEENVRKLAAFCDDAGVRLRAHAKTHKCPEIALRQIAAGAVGVCCQKVGEAEALVEGGVQNVLVTNQIWGTTKLKRLAQLASEATIGVCVDDLQNIKDIAAVARALGVSLDVYVEIDVGANRCGVEAGIAAAQLAKVAAEEDGIKFAGLQAYHGSAQHIRSYNERGAAIGSVGEKIKRTLQALEAVSLKPEIVTGAGTGTFPFEAASGLYHELQCGSYIFMDADYALNQGPEGSKFDTFNHSLHVLVTVMSAAKPGSGVVDAGHKALGNDHGMPQVLDIEGAVYERPSDDHGQIDTSGAVRDVQLGEKIRLIPGHCDPTVNLYDWYVVHKDGRVVDLWEISARGAIR